MAMSESIRKVMENTTPGQPRQFYRAVYKATPCGPTIGFRINGEWAYNDDLPHVFFLDDVVDGISVSSIVEGSDAEVPAVRFEGDFDPDAFWQAVKHVDEQADELWRREHLTEKKSPITHHIDIEERDRPFGRPVVR